MRRRVILKALLGSGAVSALGGLGVLGTRAAAQGAAGSPAAEPYSLSYAAGGYDSRGNFLGGTELMNLTAFGGRLYAGVGYWMDRPAVFAAGYEQRGPAGPGNAQVLVLDSRGSQWRQEYAFGQAHRLSAMEIVRFPRANVAMLAVGLDSGNGGVFTQRAPGVWENTGVPTQTPIRSLAVHYDTADGREKLFAATGGAEDRYFDRAVYAGSYDPGAPGRIRWDPTPERVSAEARTMSMTECDGVLYAAAKPSIYRRNDARRGWEVLYTNPISDSFGHTHFTSGFRGLTCIAGPDG
ncbi:MAG TPA: hypothetical protein VMB84_02355, partial [Stellaceae bacterium]|nr:hypothetical protein [Stellaceae bacterium]